MNNRITPYNITELKTNEIFVFGSNSNGVHNGNAAATDDPYEAAQYNEMSADYYSQAENWKLPEE